MRRLWREAAILALAVQFLTRVPVPEVRFSPARMTASLRHFPLVGAAIGLAAALVFSAAAALWPQPVAAVVTLAFSVLLTGALHEDGFADACDGLGGGMTAARALEIMKDSRIGTYGGAGLVFMLLGRIMVLAMAPPAAVVWLLVAGHGASRASVVVAVATSRYVRAAGTAKPVAEGIGRGGLLWAMVCGGLALLCLVPLGIGTLLAGGGGLVAGHLAMRAFYERRLGGYTGDCLGAVQQMSEIGLLLGALACL